MKNVTRKWHSDFAMTAQSSAATNTEKHHAGIHTAQSLDPYLVLDLI